MIYLSCPVKEAVGAHPRLGAMLTPRHKRGPSDALRFPFWAADNGCFSQGDRFDLEAYLAWLVAMAPARHRCLFATAPDVVGDAAATWERSRDVLPAIRALGYGAALVAQDGLERTAVPWDAFEALFVGGTTRWKLGEAAYALVVEAKARGKWTHMGRVNGGPRFLMAHAAGYDSADGTELRFNAAMLLPRVLRWLDAAQAQRPLWSTV